jgi:hypothetical protein
MLLKLALYRRALDASTYLQMQQQQQAKDLQLQSSVWFHAADAAEVGAVQASLRRLDTPTDAAAAAGQRLAATV